MSTHITIVLKITFKDYTYINKEIKLSNFIFDKYYLHIFIAFLHPLPEDVEMLEIPLF